MKESLRESFKQLLLTLVKGLFEKPDQISIEVGEPTERGVTVYRLHVAPSDMGRVIGKQGRIAKAIRMVMRSSASRKRQKVAVEIAQE